MVLYPKVNICFVNKQKQKEGKKMKTQQKRKMSPFERVFMCSPYAIVTIVARIKGNVTESILKDAVKKAQKRHQNLSFRIQDKYHMLYFTTEDVNDVQIDVKPRQSEDQWIEVQHEQSMTPFEFTERPAIRFTLLNSAEKSDLILSCHHIVGDGMSLAYLARDIMTYLGDENHEIEVLPDPAPVNKDNLPAEVGVNRVVKYFINRINKSWAKKPTYFDQLDYLSLNKAYWMTFEHKVISVELSESQTNSLVERCRKEKVTVNTAITSAFATAQSNILGDKANSNIAIAGNLRDYLPKPAGEAVGNFAAGVNLKYEPDQKQSFWDSTRKLHKKLKKLYTAKSLFKEAATWCYLDPAIMESLSFKMMGKFVRADFRRYNKLSTFSKQEDVISDILKKQKMDSLEKPFLGTAVTNLTRLDFPKTYGKLELDRLIMNPGGMFPLALVNIVVGVVTCAGKLSLLIEHEENTVDSATAEKIKEKALEILLD